MGNDPIQRPKISSPLASIKLYEYEVQERSKLYLYFMYNFKFTVKNCADSLYYLCRNIVNELRRFISEPLRSIGSILFLR